MDRGPFPSTARIRSSQKSIHEQPPRLRLPRRATRKYATESIPTSQIANEPAATEGARPARAARKFPETTVEPVSSKKSKREVATKTQAKEKKPSPDPTSNAKEDVREYEVQSILEYNPRKKQYLVKWKGYSVKDSTWEPVENLTHATQCMEEFHKFVQEKRIANGNGPQPKSRRK